MMTRLPPYNGGMLDSAAAIQRMLADRASGRRAKALRWFFKTGPGEYGEGDRFRGLTVPQLREVAGECGTLPEREVLRLLASPWHEDRLLAVILLARRSGEAGPRERARLCRVYLRHRAGVNNWDLVDLSAVEVVGPLVGARVPPFLRRLVRSRAVWDRRIALLATFHEIKRGRFGPSLALGRMLLRDPHDLMHKALGWMLREIWKRDPRKAEAFLRRHATALPRTAMRYAIERMPERRRKRFLALD